jgi:hypothetical protein
VAALCCLTISACGHTARNGTSVTAPARTTQSPATVATTPGAVTGKTGKPTKHPHIPLAQAITQFILCMRSHGINYPAPTAGTHGPVFDTSKLDKQSSGYKTALKTCRPLLLAGV